MKKRWNPGDVFLIPNADGCYTPGQIIAREERALACASCAIFDQRVSSIEDAKHLKLELDKCFAALLITPESLNTFKWKIVGNQPVVLPKKMYPYEDILSQKKPGARVIGSENVSDFVDAFYKLRPWDDWHDKNYLDSLLISPQKKPTDSIYINKDEVV